MTTSVLLLHCDGVDGSTSFPDSSVSGHIVTAQGDAQVDTAQKKFGTGSILFDGTGDYLTIPNSADFNFAGDFTMECWFRFNTLVNGVAISNHPDGWIFGITFASVYFEVHHPSYFLVNWGSFSPVINTWYHVAVTRSGTNVRLFLDGDLKDSGNSSLTFSSSSQLAIGSRADGSYAMNGHIDEIRIVNGEALYTSNFTPPTGPFIEDFFTTTLQYKNASSVFVPVTASLGDIGSNIAPGSKTAYWDNPSQDRPSVEISDAQVQLQGTPDPGNSGTYTLNITGASQLTASDGTGAQGDVKVEYEIT